MSELKLPFRLVPCLIVVALGGCAVGPNFVKPRTEAPEDWTTWRSSDETLRGQSGEAGELQPDWWRGFQDPVLDRLEQQAFENSPDLKTAALHFAQARVQRLGAAAQQLPQLDVSGGAMRERQSEYGAGTRMLDLIGGSANRATLAELLAQPFTLYQAGFDASWELDLWGRVRRSVEAADADVARQAALLDLTRLSLASEVAQGYFELRSTQRQIELVRADVAALEERLSLIEARVRGGVSDALDLERQRTELAALKAQLPPLLAQEASAVNQITLLLGQRPGALQTQLQPAAGTTALAWPDLALGVPAEAAARRPDIRAAEAQLRSATASIGVARAALYPSIRLGGHFGYESYVGSEFGDWGSRTWSVGPSLSLPLFDHGRLKSVVELRELQQQEAAVSYQRTVLQAWREIDDALNSYAAERQQALQLKERADSAGAAYALVRARYDGGTVDFTTVLDAQRSDLQARRDLAASEERLGMRFVTVNKAIGNVPQWSKATTAAVP